MIRLVKKYITQIKSDLIGVKWIKTHNLYFYKHASNSDIE